MYNQQLKFIRVHTLTIPKDYYQVYFNLRECLSEGQTKTQPHQCRGLLGLRFHDLVLLNQQDFSFTMGRHGMNI
jgi:hypothetical protein